MARVRVRLFFDANTLKNELNRWRIRKITSLTNDDELYKELATAYAKKLDPYVPYTDKDHGPKNQHKHLAKYTIGGKKDGITYSATNRGFGYAKVQYAPEEFGKDESKWKRDRSVHPLARSHWGGEDVQKIIWKSFVKEARPIVKKYAKRKDHGGMY